ncbi:unnamed protein product, partial [Musa hybrid cultivar]
PPDEDDAAAFLLLPDPISYLLLPQSDVTAATQIHPMRTKSPSFRQPNPKRRRRTVKNRRGRGSEGEKQLDPEAKP